ncbi:hypothetical protein Hte_008493 [Hypoxylon texense]
MEGSRANYVTKWVDLSALSEIKSTRKSLGLDPVRFFSNGEPFYTLPAIKDPSTNTLVGDSMDIAVYLDKKYPDGSSLFGNSIGLYAIGLYAALNAQMDTTFATGAALCAETFPFNPETAEKSKAEFCRRAGVETWDELIVRGEKRKPILDALEVVTGEVAAV